MSCRLQYTRGERDQQMPTTVGGAVDWTQPAANYKIGLSPFATKEEAMRAVQWEQRLEFAMEGRRFFDLRRWDDLPAGLRVDMAATLNAFQRRLENQVFHAGASFENRDKFMPVHKVRSTCRKAYLFRILITCNR